MYEPNVRRKSSGVPIVSKEEIDMIAEKMLLDFDPALLNTPQEIDIDLFVQDYLGMDQDFQYLSHNGIYLGMTVFNDTDCVPVYDPQTNRAEYVSERAKTILIDNRLTAPNQEHRYRFTMGHESGHGVFHGPYFVKATDSLDYFDHVWLGELYQPIVKCRIDDYNSSGRKTNGIWSDIDWMEWQANTFSSAILMPKKTVIEVANSCIGNRRPSRFRDYSVIKEVAMTFNVSEEAVRIRLAYLDLISKEYSTTRNE